VRRDTHLRERVDEETLARLYTEFGMSPVELAERYGVNPAAVYSLLDEYRIPRRRPGRLAF
jgi:hypothetical protein